MLALRYVLNNPQRVAKILLAFLAVALVVVLSLSVEAVPTWIGLLGLGAVPGYVARIQWGKLSLLVTATEVPAGQVSPGVVEVSGTARPAVEGASVSPDGDDAEYLAYKRVERVDTDPGDSGEPLPGLDKQAGDHDRAAVPITVEDETGSVLVDTDNADIMLSWDNTRRTNRRTTKWAALEPGDQVTVYGTAMSPEQRRPPGFVDSPADSAATRQRTDFDETAAAEDVVVSLSQDTPYLVLSDRSGLGLLGRQAAVFAATALLAVALVGAAVLNAVGVLAV